MITHFVNEVTKVATANKFRFDMFASIMPDEDQTAMIVWPLCYISCILEKFGQRYGIFKSLHQLVHDKLRAYMQKTESGLDWGNSGAISYHFENDSSKGFTGAFKLIQLSTCVDDVVKSRVCQF